ncbi:MAG TPA: lipopolysaccharide biosynthesis protein [Rhizomicrobium sp.]|jgi:O-antigen/teichoic acid export membrane protein|nr:lipopolysaccharide biosynthesis protein [Rhizomicrobium sp.]
MTSPAPQSLKRHMAKGSAWTVAVRWSVRLLGLVSTIILARLLMPRDFGIVTIGMIVVGMVEIFNQTGHHLAIIRHPDPTRAHYDSAWTIFIILSTLLGAAVFFAAPMADIYFHEPRAIPVVRILAFKTVMSGFDNIGVVDFRRDLKFHRQFLYQTLPSVISFVVTLVAAFALRNYWALVIGIMVQEFFTLVLSYILSPYRPRLSLAKARELWSFSVWTFLKNIGVYIGSQVDKLAIGNFAGAAAMGRYEVAVDLASSPSQEINNPMIAVLFPVMAKTLGDRARLKELYLTVLYWSVLICSSTSIGVALVTSDMVDVVLGPQWQDVKPLMPWLAIAYGLWGMVWSVYPAFDVVGKPEISARMQWANVALLTGCIVPAALFFHSLQAVVEARFVYSAIMLPAMFWMLAREFSLRRRDFAFVFWRPLLATAVMAGVVATVEHGMTPGPLRLCVAVGAGAFTYAGCVMLLWAVVGCPDGPEKTVWHLVRRLGSKQKKTFAQDVTTGEGLLHTPSLEPEK